MREYKLYFMGGQSNMDGHGLNRDLPEDLQEAMKDVRIFCGNPASDQDASGGLGLWDILGPGFGKEFRSDGKRNFLSDYFGPELSFASELLKARPGETIAIIKYTHGGTTLSLNGAKEFGTWYPEYNIGNRIAQYDHFLSSIRNAFDAELIPGEKVKLIPAGIVWHQGESDAVQTKEMAKAYGANLRRLMALIRASLWMRDLPVVICGINDSGICSNTKAAMNYGDIVYNQQEEFVKDDYFAAFVEANPGCRFIDEWHYTSEGYIDLGKRAAHAMIKLQNIENNYSEK